MKFNASQFLAKDEPIITIKLESLEAFTGVGVPRIRVIRRIWKQIYEWQKKRKQFKIALDTCQVTIVKYCYRSIDNLAKNTY